MARNGRFFASRGFVVAIQDLRGRYESEGTYTAWSGVERNDGYDTVDWLARQPWSTGKIGTFGCSYVGEVQVKLAATRHPAHVAAITQGSGAAYAGTGLQAGGLVSRGVLEMAAGFGWARWTGQKHFWRDLAELHSASSPSYVTLPVVPATTPANGSASKDSRRR